MKKRRESGEGISTFVRRTVRRICHCGRWNFSIKIMREPRAAVMIVVEATWEDHGGTLHTIAARMENKSASGACLRVETPIPVGSKLSIQAPRERFACTVKYCISDGMDYLVGVQRQAANVPLPVAPILQPSQQLGGTVETVPVTGKKKSRSSRKGKSRGAASAKPAHRRVRAPVAESASRETSVSERHLANVSPAAVQSPADNFAARLDAVLQARQHPPQPPTEEEKRIMRRKWLESALWNSKENNKGNGNGKGEGNTNGGEDAIATGARVSSLAPVTEKAGDNTAAGVMRSHVEYLPMEDIYLAAGIVNLRRGYSINKVVEMLRSEHMRGLSKEMKRAAVLMALDAAGISVAEVSGDALARQEALDAYEAEQKKQAEAEWARKAEEIAQIQADLERVQEQYAARISRHRDAVTREKSAFSSWQAVKRQESQRMAEATELCLKPSNSEAGGQRAEINTVAASARTM